MYIGSLLKTVKCQLPDLLLLIWNTAALNSASSLRQVICSLLLLFQLQIHRAPVPTHNLVVSCHLVLKGVLDSHSCFKLLLTVICWEDKLLVSESTKTCCSLLCGWESGKVGRGGEQQEREYAQSSVMIVAVFK